MTATGGDLWLAIVVAVAVPIVYAVVTKMVDFLVRWELKGRRSRGEYRFWTRDQHAPDWDLHTGDVERLVALHGNGSEVAHVEQSVRFRKANPYSLGLDLTAAAIAVDVASLLSGQGDPAFVGWAVLLHSLFFAGVFVLVLSNQNAAPYEVWWARSTAAAAVFVGALAMVSSFLGLDAELVRQLLNIGGR